MATLVETCEPLFQYICRLNRLGRKGGLVDAGQVRSELRSMLSEVKLRAEGSGLGEQFAKVRLPLIYFVDFMVRESALPFARTWKHLQEEELKRIAGDQDFFVQLDETLSEQGEAANQRLAVFYSCLALGFTGMYTGQADGPMFLRKKMLEIAARIRPMMDAEENSRICPEAYQKVDTRELEIAAAPGVLRWVVVLAIMVVALLAANWIGYREATDTIGQALDGIKNNTASAEAAK
ncbi:MAG: DotU family type IV/VI secretion system protein [Phycisphaerae bacterium]|nr:DotU family type IV/VI secretion system protein [Phycisphaerae bacterium]